MHRWGSALAAVVVVALAAVATPARGELGPGLPADCPAAPCVIERTVPLDGDYGEIDPRILVALPAGYDGIAELPVVYLLHGVGDTYLSWVANTDVEDLAGGLGVIVVTPDGGRTPEAGYYSDWADGSRRWESFHTGPLVAFIDEAFATLEQRQHRAVVGLSMGGFGAMKYAARHPELFGAAASFSGILDTQLYGPAEAIAFAALSDHFGTPDERVWGDGVTQPGAWAEHNPAALARGGALGHLGGSLWLTTGTGTPGGPAGEDTQNPSRYGVEQFIWQTNQSFEASLTLAGTAYHDEGYLGGTHHWPYWQHALHQVLPDVAAAIG